jgi:hypothetical protein
MDGREIAVVFAKDRRKTAEEMRPRGGGRDSSRDGGRRNGGDRRGDRGGDRNGGRRDSRDRWVNSLHLRLVFYPSVYSLSSFFNLSVILQIVFLFFTEVGPEIAMVIVEEMRSADRYEYSHFVYW